MPQARKGDDGAVESDEQRGSPELLSESELCPPAGVGCDLPTLHVPRAGGSA